MRKSNRTYYLRAQIQKSNGLALKRWALERSTSVSHLLDVMLSKTIPEQYRKSYDKPTEE